MAAADAILVPLQCEFLRWKACAIAEDRRAGARDPHPRLSIHGIVLTMYDARNIFPASGGRCAPVHGRQGLSDIISAQCAGVRGAVYGKPVLLYDLKCPGSQAYVRLASEIIQREKTLRAAS